MVFKLDLSDMDRHKTELRLYLDKARRRFKEAKMDDEYETIMNNVLKKLYEDDPNQRADLSINISQISPEGVRRLMNFLGGLVKLCAQDEQQHRMLQETLRNSLLDSVRYANSNKPSCFFCCQSIQRSNTFETGVDIDDVEQARIDVNEVRTNATNGHTDVNDHPRVLMLQRDQDYQLNDAPVPPSQDTPDPTPVTSPNLEQQTVAAISGEQPRNQQQPLVFNFRQHPNENSQFNGANVESSGNHRQVNGNDHQDTSQPMQVDEEYLDPNASTPPRTVSSPSPTSCNGEQSSAPSNGDRVISLVNPIARIKIDMANAHQAGSSNGIHETHSGNKIEKAISRIKRTKSSTSLSKVANQNGNSLRGPITIKIKRDLSMNVNDSDTDSDNEQSNFHSPIGDESALTQSISTTPPLRPDNVQRQIASSSFSSNTQSNVTPIPSTSMSFTSAGQSESLVGRSARLAAATMAIASSASKFATTRQKERDSLSSTINNVKTKHTPPRFAVLLDRHDLPIRTKPNCNSVKRNKPSSNQQQVQQEESQRQSMVRLKTKRIPKRLNK